MTMETTDLGSAVRANLSAQVAEAIKNYIISNNLPPGSKLPSERELIAKLKVSRNILREAIKSLESVGIIEVRVGDGTYVCEFGYKSLIGQMSYALARHGSEMETLVEARVLFEVAALDLIARNMTAENIERIETIIDKIGGAGTVEANMEADLEFHTALAEISGNPVVSEICAFLQQFFFYAREYARPSMMMADVQSHQRLLDALVKGNIELAKGLMVEHIQNWKEE